MKSKILVFRIVTITFGLLGLLVGALCIVGGAQKSGVIGIAVGVAIFFPSLYALFKILSGDDPVTRKLKSVEGETRAAQDQTAQLQVPSKLKQRVSHHLGFFVMAAFPVLFAYFAAKQNGLSVNLVLITAVALAAIFAFYDACRFEIRGTKVRRTGVLPFFQGEIDLRDVRAHSFDKGKNGRIKQIKFYNVKGERLMSLPVSLYDVQFLIDWLKKSTVSRDQLDGPNPLPKTGS